MKKLPSVVFIDRDGTIMEDAHYIKEVEQVRLLPGAARALKRINDAKVPVIVITNQSAIGRGLIALEDYEAVRKKLDSLLEREGAHIDASYFCPDDPRDPRASGCRKPATNMFEDAIREHKIEPTRAAYIGDRWRDVAPSRQLGGRGILIYSPMTTDEDRRKAQEDKYETAPSLQVAVDMLFGLTEKDSAP